MSRIVDKLGRANGLYYHGLLSHPDCSACPLRRETKVLPDGPVPARIAFVGEGPGNQEVGVGRGFIGPSGQLLWRLAEQTQYILWQQFGIELPLRREDVWVTNAALCKSHRRDGKVILENNAEINGEQVKSLATMHCRLRLIQELIRVDPIVIVPLGSWSLWAIGDMPKSKIYSYRGSRTKVELEGLAHAIITETTRVPFKKPRT
jgi:uracil-DNA glycosylase family 4